MIDIAAAVVALLAPYLAKAGESMASKLGEKAVEATEALLQIIRDKFAKDKDTYAEQTLQRVEKEPEDKARQAALRGVLEEKIQADPAFAQKLTQLVSKTTQGQSLNQFLTNVYGGEVGNMTNIGTAGDLTFGDVNFRADH